MTKRKFEVITPTELATLILHLPSSLICCVYEYCSSMYCGECLCFVPKDIGCLVCGYSNLNIRTFTYRTKGKVYTYNYKRQTLDFENEGDKEVEAEILRFNNYQDPASSPIFGMKNFTCIRASNKQSHSFLLNAKMWIFLPIDNDHYIACVKIKPIDIAKDEESSSEEEDSASSITSTDEEEKEESETIEEGDEGE